MRKKKIPVENRAPAAARRWYLQEEHAWLSQLLQIIVAEGPQATQERVHRRRREVSWEIDALGRLLGET